MSFLSLSVINLFLSFFGFIISFHIYEKKSQGVPLICPAGFDCLAVVSSRFGRFLGVPNYFLGMFYYGLIAFLSAITIISAGSVGPIFFLFLFLLSGTAFLFSLYLLFIQSFVLRQYCLFCLLSAALASGIFLISFSFSSDIVSVFLKQYRILVLIGHNVGTAIAVGAVTVSDIFFFKFLRDLKISDSEKEILSTLSEIVWFGAGILVLTGFGLYLPFAGAYNLVPKFLVKMVIFLIILINGFVLNLVITPRLTQISFGGRHDHKSGELHTIRRLAFASGAISITSWYSALILGLTKPPYAFSQIFGIYLLVIGLAIFISQVVELRLRSQVSAIIPD